MRLPLRGEAEVVRRDESGREVRLWFRGSEDDPLPSVVLDQQTIVDVQRPGSLLETVEQGDRRELIQRMKQALQPGGWSFHEATEQEPDHFHDAGDLVRVELRGNRVVLVTRRREGEATPNARKRVGPEAKSQPARAGRPNVRRPAEAGA